ncbi:MAG TPA: M20/M25/M40 family metallo-hydrolase [Chitinophagales bacterium]|nr:M20/M25/M40 family metallo-hydrolase [Chitinophagales bacterium]
MKAKTVLKLLIAALAAVLQCGTLHAQLAADLKQHISVLASDSLHGRMTGTADEIKAADYIISQFVKEGIPNAGGNFEAAKYLQAFEYTPNIDSVKKHIHGNNVVAYMDNHAANTVIIGAHYDHLGWGDTAYSLYRGPAAIHHGADDNASGVATVIELARWLKIEGPKSNNYLFIAFSGEEEGLYGSKWYTQHPTIELKNADYMLNFDMVGRLDSNTHTLIVNGVGTSPAWKEVISKIPTQLHIKTTESGIGPSDQTSFYLKDIPVLFFFTGQHADYHKPSDVESKINYAGMVQVVDYTEALIKDMDSKGKLAFTKTKDENNENAPKFKVTMGVIPDYTFEGKGMRIDGVSDGKPASKAGIQAGDVVVQLGAVKVTDLMSYMKGLGQFNKGDITTVKVKRGNKTLKKKIQF